MTDPSPPHPPKQSRSRRTLERIVQASLDILSEDGPEGLTVQAIVERAGSSVGSFYARFSGKEELLAYLGERAWRAAASRWDEAAASREIGGLALPLLVEGAMRLLGDAVRARAGYLKALPRGLGGGRDASAAFQEHVLRGLEELLLRRASEMSHPAPEVGVRLGLRAALAVLEEGVEGEDGRPPIPADRRTQEATALLLGYLTGGSHGDAAGRVDFFDVWG